MASRKPTDGTVKLRLREDLREYLAQEARLRGHSITREIARRLENSREQEVRQGALLQIASTATAVETTINAVDELLTLVRTPGSAGAPRLDGVRPKDQRR
jgi:hypothetical protein